jgi:hypothetical protein
MIELILYHVLKMCIMLIFIVATMPLCVLYDILIFIAATVTFILCGSYRTSIVII